MMKKILFIILILTPLLCWDELEANTAVNRIVAHVNGESITLYELQNRAEMFLGVLEGGSLEDLPPEQRNETKKHVLDQMINDILIRQEAQRYQIHVSDRDIDQHIQRVRENNNLDEEEFEERLGQQGLTLQDYKDQIRDSMLRQRVLNMMVQRKTMVTQEDIKEFYQANKEDFEQERKVHLQAIVVPKFEKAQELWDQIQDGEYTFEEAAQKYSQGTAAAQGGDMGFVRWDRLASEWKEVLKEIDPQEMSEPFATRGGGALLRVKEEHSAGVVPLEEVEDEIRDELFDQKLEKRFEEYIQGLREEAIIDIRY